MKNKIHSLRDLKTTYRESTLGDGLALADKGEHSQAVTYFDMLADFSTVDNKSKSLIKTSYCIHGKYMRHEGRFKEALRAFSRAQEAYRLVIPESSVTR